MHGGGERRKSGCCCRWLFCSSETGVCDNRGLLCSMRYIYNCVVEIRFTITHYPRQRVSHHSVVSAPCSGFTRHVGSHIQRKWLSHPPNSFGWCRWLWSTASHCMSSRAHVLGSPLRYTMGKRGCSVRSCNSHGQL